MKGRDVWAGELLTIPRFAIYLEQTKRKDSLKTKITLTTRIFVRTRLPSNRFFIFPKYSKSIVYANFERVIEEYVQLGSTLPVHVWRNRGSEYLVLSPMMIVSDPKDGNIQQVRITTDIQQLQDGSTGIEAAKLELWKYVKERLLPQHFEMVGEVTVKEETAPVST